MGFSKKELAEALKQMELQGKAQKHMQESAGNYLNVLRDIGEVQKSITHAQLELNEAKEQEKRYTEEAQELLNKYKKGRKKLNADEKKALKEQIYLIIKKRRELKDGSAILNSEVESLKAQNKELVEVTKKVSKINLLHKESLKFLKKTPGLLKQGYGKLRGYGLFEMDKSIRMAGVEMGKVVDVSSALGKNIVNASTQTQSMGIHVKDLAKMQSSYSSELGRSVMLSEQGYEAMGQMAAGTILGKEGAAALAAEMDNFNISVVKSSEIIEEISNTTMKMGLNSGKVIKSLQSNLKMANKYHFKGGVKGMAAMAAQAVKFGITMDATSGMADKLFDVEGAVEMAAKLNTMGGEWAQLGDPMKLMNMARNDMAGLQSSVIDATANMADFNKETGEFEFSGLELHRMKELEKITGVSAENMAKMGKNKAKFDKINSSLGMDVDDDMKEFIANTSVFEGGEYKIKLSSEEELIPIKQLNDFQKKQMIADSISLKERAINSQSFDDQMSNMLENAKTLLLPLLEGLNKALPDIIKGFKDLMSGDLAAGIKSAAKSIGGIVGKAIKLFMMFPKQFGALALLILTPAKWILNGAALGKGFMAVARRGMGGAGGGAGSGGGGGQYRDPKTGRYAKAPKMGRMGRMGKMGGGAAGMIGMAGGMALDYGRSQMDDPNSGGGKAMGIGSAALQGASMGGMIGSIIPGVGTLIGAGVGGLIGGGMGAYNEFKGPESNATGMAGSIASAPPVEDAYVANGKVTPIDSKDKVFEISKPGGAYDKAANSKSSGGSGGGTSVSNIKLHISFDELKVSAGSDVGKIDLDNDSVFIRELATKVKEALSKTANGGVLSPNPS